MNIVYMSLGSNIGKRESYLQRCLHELTNHASIQIVTVSSIYVTKPVGEIVQRDFLNLVVKIITRLEPEALLDDMQALEKRLDRQRELRWGPRTIDIALLYFNEEQLFTERLTLPHREVLNRLFVIIPLLDCCDASFYEFSNLLINKKRLIEAGEQQVVKWTGGSCDAS